MTLKNINEEIGVIKAHLDQDLPDMEFIVRHAETLLVLAHELAASNMHDAHYSVLETYHARPFGR